jgi:hypothetical protein
MFIEGRGYFIRVLGTKYSSIRSKLIQMVPYGLLGLLCSITGVPNLGDARGLKSVISWVHLYQWGDAIDVRGDADTKRLGTPALLG